MRVQRPASGGGAVGDLLGQSRGREGAHEDSFGSAKGLVSRTLCQGTRPLPISHLRCLVPSDSVTEAPQPGQRQSRSSIGDRAEHGAGHGATARTALDKKKSILFGLFGLAVITLIFVRVIPQIGSYKDALTSMEAMTAGSLVCIVMSVLVYLAVYGLPFAAATPGLAYWRSQQLNEAAFAISNGVPAGGAFGLGVQYAMLASYGVEPTVSTAAITAVGVWSIFVTLGLPILGVAAIQLSGRGASAYLWSALLGLLMLALTILTLAFIVRSENAARRVGSIVNRIAARFRKARSVDSVTIFLMLRRDIAELVTRRWPAITCAQRYVKDQELG